MPVSGLVLILSEDESTHAATLQAIGDDPRVEVGPRQGRRVAVVVDTDSSDEDKVVWHRLQSLAGVDLVELTFVGFEPAAAHSDPTRAPRPISDNSS